MHFQHILVYIFYNAKLWKYVSFIIFEHFCIFENLHLYGVTFCVFLFVRIYAFMHICFSFLFVLQWFVRFLRTSRPPEGSIAFKPSAGRLALISSCPPGGLHVCLFAQPISATNTHTHIYIYIYIYIYNSYFNINTAHKCKPRVGRFACVGLPLQRCKNLVSGSG